MPLQDFAPTQTITNPVIPGGTAGSILFFGTGGAVSQNNAALFWNNAKSALTATNIQAKGNPWFDVKAYGAVGDGVTDDHAAIQAAIDAAYAAGGGTVFFPLGIYNITTTLIWRARVNLKGYNALTTNGAGPTGTQIISSTTDLISTDSASVRGSCKISGLTLVSQAGGGHIFLSSTIVTNIEYYNCAFYQLNTGKSVLNSQGSTGASGYFGNWWHDCQVYYQAGCTVPAINVVNFTINQIVIERMLMVRSANTSNGVQAVWIESTNTSGATIGCRFAQWTMEQPGGGVLNLLSVSSSVIEGIGVYDQSVVPANPGINIASHAGGPASANNLINDCYIRCGSAAHPDLQIDSTITGSTLTVNGGNFSYIDGKDTAGNFMCATMVDVQYTQTANLGYVQTVGGEISFNHSVGLLTSVEMRMGRVANFDGFFQLYINGAYALSVNNSKDLRIGGTQTSPNLQLRNSGRIASNEHIYPGTPALAGQANCGLLAGSGAPNNANGNDGDIYFRSDGGALTTVYQRRTGAWVGIV